MKFFLFIIVLILFIYLLERFLNKLFKVEEMKLSETPGKKIDQWGRGIILVIMLSSLPFVIGDNLNLTKWFYTFFIIALFGFQIFLEWTYLRSSNKYKVTVVFLFLSVILVYKAEYLIELLW